MIRSRHALAVLALLLPIGCVKVEPIKVEPIHITMDINIKIDRQLDDFFDFEEEVAADETEEGDSEGETAEAKEGESQ